VIYIDTGAFLARHIRRDQYHKQAQAAWKTLSRLPWRCYTSNFVLDETFTLLARRTSYSFAVQRARSIINSTSLEILRPSQEDELAALDLFEQFADREVSFTDCVSFVLMRGRQLKRVFSFDRHFRHAGFTLWPESQ